MTLHDMDRFILGLVIVGLIIIGLFKIVKTKFNKSESNKSDTVLIKAKEELKSLKEEEKFFLDLLNNATKPYYSTCLDEYDLIVEDIQPQSNSRWFYHSKYKISYVTYDIVFEFIKDLFFDITYSDDKNSQFDEVSTKLITGNCFYRDFGCSITTQQKLIIIRQMVQDIYKDVAEIVVSKGISYLALILKNEFPNAEINNIYYTLEKYLEYHNLSCFNYILIRQYLIDCSGIDIISKIDELNKVFSEN